MLSLLQYYMQNKVLCMLSLLQHYVQNQFYACCPYCNITCKISFMHVVPVATLRSNSVLCMLSLMQHYVQNKCYVCCPCCNITCKISFTYAMLSLLQHYMQNQFYVRYVVLIATLRAKAVLSRLCCPSLSRDRDTAPTL